MSDTKEQAKLLSESRSLVNTYESKESVNLKKNYILKFIKKHSMLIFGLVVLFVTQGLSESLIIFISRGKLIMQSNFFTFYFWQIFLVLIIVFILSSFFSIKQEKTITVLFINDLRRRIFKNYLSSPLKSMSPERQGELIAKISYHLPLVSMGISNAVFGALRWLIYFLAALFVAYLSGLNLALVALCFLVVSMVIALSSYFVVKRYVSQEVTFYSQIIKQIDSSLSEKYFTKRFNLEASILNKFDQLVKFDSIFRVRRDLWMKMGFNVVFVLLLLISFFVSYFYNDISLRLNLIAPDLKFLYIFLLIYLSRVAVESLRVGLYYFPAKLGLSLTIIRTRKPAYRRNSLKIDKEITFYSKKIKLFKQGRYHKNIKFNFKRKGRYAIVGPSLSGKTTLAKALAGIDVYTKAAFKIKMDNKRLDFSVYQAGFNDFYFFDPLFYSHKSLLELIIGENRDESHFNKVEKALHLVSENEYLAQLITEENNLSVSARNIWSNNLSAFALHSLHCLFKEPSLIIIDNLWLDLDYEAIDKMIKILSDKLPNSILVLFSSKDINNIKFDKRYDLGK